MLTNFKHSEVENSHLNHQIWLCVLLCWFNKKFSIPHIYTVLHIVYDFQNDDLCKCIQLLAHIWKYGMKICFDSIQSMHWLTQFKSSMFVVMWLLYVYPCCYFYFYFWCWFMCAHKQMNEWTLQLSIKWKICFRNVWLIWQRMNHDWNQTTETIFPPQTPFIQNISIAYSSYTTHKQC